MRLPALIIASLLGTVAAANAVGESGWRPIYPGGTKPQDYAYEAGSGATAGAAGQTAYLRNAGDGGPRDYGTIQQKIPLEAWRGKRVRLTLPLKLEGDGVALAWASIQKSNAIVIRAQAQPVAGGGAWQPHQFVLDVPADASDFAVAVRLRGRSGTVWADEVKLEAVSDDVALSRRDRIDLEGTPGPSGGGPSYTPPR